MEVPQNPSQSPPEIPLWYFIALSKYFGSYYAEIHPRKTIFEVHQFQTFFILMGKGPNNTGQ